MNISLLLDIHVVLSIGARDENFDQSLHLHLYFVCTSSEGSCEYVHKPPLDIHVDLFIGANAEILI